MAEIIIHGPINPLSYKKTETLGVGGGVEWVGDRHIEASHSARFTAAQSIFLLLTSKEKR